MKKLFGPVGSAIWLLVIAGAVFGWAKANDIRDPVDAYNYFKGWSDKTSECYGDDKDIWRCDGNGPTDPGDIPNNGGEPTELSQEAYDKLLVKLDKLPTTPSSKDGDYDRGAWKHWSDLDKNGCDTRDDVLIAQGKELKFEAGSKCETESGQWVSPYDKVKFTDPSKMDIDHVIPLGYASKHGGYAWPEDKKEAYANDFSQLLATSARENRKKSDRGPSEYMPPEKTYWCSYAQIWVNTATKYGIWLEKEDKAKLKEALGTC